MTAHEQVWAKVNAPVDRGVVGLIEALSQFPGLETVESCEGNGRDAVWICFRFGRYWREPWRDLVEFIFGFFAPKLFEAVGDSASITVRPRESGTALADLSVRQDAKEQVEDALRNLAAEFSAAPRRSLAYCDGKSDTSQLRCSAHTDHPQ